MEIMMLRVSLLPKTQLHWILHHQTTLCLDEIVIYLMNTLRKLTLAICLLSYLNNFDNLKTNLPAWNLPPTHLHLQQSWCSLEINCNTSLWCSNHIQPPSLMRNPCTKLCRHAWTTCIPQREANVTMTLLQVIPMLNGQDSSKLQDIETATDILTESHTHLA